MVLKCFMYMMDYGNMHLDIYVYIYTYQLKIFLSWVRSKKVF